MDAVDPRTGMTPREVRLVQNDWEVVKKNTIPIGVQIFISLFTTYPEYQKLFSSLADIPLSELGKNKKMAAHASTVMYTLTSVVDNLLDPEVNVEILAKIGKNHRARHLTKKHFIDLRELIVDVLEKNLKWNDQKSLEAWTKTLEFMYKGIYQGLDELAQ